MDHSYFLDLARQQANQSVDQGGKFRGAVLVKESQVIAQSGDQTRQHNNPIAVAEMECIRQAGRRNDHRDLTLYMVQYPDMLTAGTVIQFLIGTLVIGLAEAQTPEISLLRSRDVNLIFIDTAKVG